MAVAVGLAFAAVPAQATFRGGNGKIAHVYNDGGNVEIFTVSPDGNGRINITNHPAVDTLPRWSPDGTKIAFVSERAGNRDIWVMNADGSNPTPLTTDPAHDFGPPEWSPDGMMIAFSSNRNGDAGNELWVMDADGSNETEITDGPGTDIGSSWSPDGTRLAFTRNVTSNPPPDRADVYTVNVDGSGLTLLTPEPNEGLESKPSWSSEGSKIAWQQGSAIWTMNADGTGKQNIFTGPVVLRGWAPAAMQILAGGSATSTHGPTTMNADGTDVRQLWEDHQFPEDSEAQYTYGGEIWSPDGRFVAGDRALCHVDIPCQPTQVFVLDADGVNLLEIGLGSGPDWQPIPVNAYPRPRGASPQRLSLVPAYEQCTAPNRTHGNPLAFPSCNPPEQVSSQLTLGTPDANGQPAKSVSHVRINPVRGLPSTPADEADVRLRGVIDDVRLASNLSDYTGDLELRLVVQITDRDNTPSPQAATVQELIHSHPLPCAATANTTVGATCAFDTTVEALVPGAVKELQRAIWALDQVQVHDGAGDPFLRQGVFVP